jgi:chromosome segregation and condensation protein ScpB
MIKDGQIEMLQKLITNRYSPKEGNNINYYHTKQHMQAFEISNKDEKHKTSFNN